ncbi:hypothetical protein PG988_012604 [Apiospora saccharicola]
MEHVAKYHGKIIGLTEVRVLDPIMNNTIEIPETAAQFWAFPGKQGWEVAEDFRLKLKDGHEPNCDLAVLLQAWLFFGLCLSVIQRDFNPILSYDELVRGNKLSTEGLSEALRQWYLWELQQHETNEDHNDLRLRMVQVAYILDYARQVIRRNCACTGVNDTVEYSVDDGPLKVEDEHALVLMCLGEALCEMKAKITQECSIDLTGWHAAEDQEGWGPPRFVLQRMKNNNWCPRAMRLLRGRFSANATLLVSAYYACDEPENSASRHTNRGCTPYECCYMTIDNLNRHSTKHMTKDCTCAAFGPDHNKVFEILAEESSTIPLLKFGNREDENDHVSLEVLGIDPKDLGNLEFVAISHVWSDGWGNEHFNKLNCCQLKRIQRQIEWGTGNQDTPFWMDTLVVPIGRGDIGRKARNKAIQQIFHVFNAAKQTIVVDNGLMTMQEGTQIETAMKILSSGWTRRLWTLQEAHLSRSLCFAFEETERTARPLWGLPEFETQRDSVEDPAGVNIKMRVKTQLSKIITRRGAVRNGDLSVSEAATMVADIWHAARWRTTSQAQHEILVIATMLGLITDDFDAAKRRNIHETKRQQLFKVFWKRLHEKHKGAIPAGIIFLPVDKINIQGYAWAPKTWLLAHEATYPEPMSFWNPPTELFDDDGLLVHYPGFILHTTCPETRDGILGIAAMPDESSQLSFPVDKTLNEWYAFTKAEEHSYTTFENLQRSTSKLAIIAARLPEELPREIALLVEIKESRPPKADCGPDAKEYCVKVVRRLYIWRRVKTSAEVENRKNSLKTGNSRSQGTKDFLIAEKLEPRQRWWVDGYVTPNPPPEVLKKQESQQVKTSSWKGVEASILSRFLGQSEPVRPAETQTE